MCAKILIQSALLYPVYYDLKSLGIAIVDTIGLSYIQDDLKITIKKPGLIIEVDTNHHLYFRSKSISFFQIAIVILKDANWYVEEFIFDATLEVAQSKFKEGKIIFQKGN